MAPYYNCITNVSVIRSLFSYLNQFYLRALKDTRGYEVNETMLKFLVGRDVTSQDDADVTSLTDQKQKVVVFRKDLVNIFSIFLADSKSTTS